MFVASASIGTAVAATASAEPDGSEVAYVNCMLQYRQYHPGATTEEVLFDCCITVGGIWSNPNDYKTGHCITNDSPDWPGRQRPLPGAAVNLPPGWNQLQ